MSRLKTRAAAFCLALSLPTTLMAVAQAAPLSKSAFMESQTEYTTTGPAPTQGQIEEIHDYLGSEAIKEFNRAQVDANNGERALPVIAGVAISAVAWCASGALSSIPTSILVDLVNRGEGGGDYVKNAIFGCAGGTIGKGAWNLVPKSVKQKIMNATVKFYLEHIRKK